MANLIEKIKDKRAPQPETPERRDVPVAHPDPQRGLTDAQVRERTDAGWTNAPVDPTGKTVKQIVLSNIFTYFNMLFFLLALCVIAVQQWLNLTFMGVIIVNTAIGIIQEIRSKKTLDKLNILASPKAVAVRGGKRVTVDTAQLVRDDIVIFAAGNQIYADAVVAADSCYVNEALITGESDEIKKNPGDRLLSGSFVVSGMCRAQLTDVGADSYVSRLTQEAKAPKAAAVGDDALAAKPRQWIGILVIPLGVVMFIKEFVWLDRAVPIAVTSTVGSTIGMIPEGLYLLTSLALVAGVVRLAQRKTLVHELGCIETLARVDTLCVDKTGTVTENKMIVEDVCPLCDDRFTLEDIRMIMADYVYAMQADNDTMAALRRYFTGEKTQDATATLPFSSAKKYGGVSFHTEETYLLGAPDVLLAGRENPYQEQIEGYSAKGCRVLLLGMYDGALSDETLSADFLPIALILLSNKIRAEAPETFGYFASQGVTVKVISGDNARTVSEVAKRAGIENADRFVDARTLTSEEAIRDAAGRYTVFGRVTPAQKRSLVQALKADGHTVAMTGDGVNDVLALKEADCSIAMASGSDVACQVSHIVLLDSNFASMPSVVAEGRRVINNIERSASLYLVKNIFSFFLAFFTLFATLPYPFSPAQLTLVSAVTIGIPSFILAMEPNESLVKGKFLRNVLFRTLPAAMTDLAMVVGILLFYIAFHLDDTSMITICTGVMGIVGLMMVHRTCQPYNTIRKVMIVVLGVLFVIAYFGFPTLFSLQKLNLQSALILIVFGLLSWPVMKVFCRLNDRMRARFEAWRAAKTAKAAERPHSRRKTA
ncbi:MAG: cation-translocating P-type ATPase [Oscillospiraceae bacterium]